MSPEEFAIIIRNLSENRISSFTAPSSKLSPEQIKMLTEALSTNTSLKHLTLYWQNLGASGAEQLAHALTINKTLVTLNLDMNDFGDRGVQYLAAAFAIHPTLTDVNISRCLISDVGAQHLATALTTSTSLQRLRLSNNNISDVGAQHLLNSLNTNQSLLHLDLQHNFTNPWISPDTHRSINTQLTRNQEIAKIKSLRAWSACSSFIAFTRANMEETVTGATNRIEAQSSTALADTKSAAELVSISRAPISPSPSPCAPGPAPAPARVPVPAAAPAAPAAPAAEASVVQEQTSSEPKTLELHQYNNSMRSLIPYIQAMAGLRPNPKGMNAFLRN